MNTDADDAYSELLEDLGNQSMLVRRRAIDDVSDYFAPREAVQLLLPLICECGESGAYAALVIANVVESSGPYAADPDRPLCSVLEKVVREVCAQLPTSELVKKANLFRILEHSPVDNNAVERTLVREMRELVRMCSVKRQETDIPCLEDAIVAGVDALRAIGHVTPETSRIVAQLSRYPNVKVHDALSEFQDPGQRARRREFDILIKTSDAAEDERLTLNLAGSAEAQRVAALRRLRSTQLYRLGRSLMEAKETERAIELLERSLRLRPNGKVFELLGECFLTTGALSEAVGPLAAATVLHRHARPAILLAEVLVRLGEKSLARDAVTLAIERQPHSRRAAEILRALVSDRPVEN